MHTLPCKGMGSVAADVKLMYIIEEEKIPCAELFGEFLAGDLLTVCLTSFETSIL